MIGLSEPNLRGNEWKYLKDCLDTGWVSTAGKYVEEFEASLAAYTNVKHAIALINGTSSLHIALTVLGVKEDDLVLLPSLTFIAPVNAVAYVGAEPFFLDSDDFDNLSVDQLKEFLESQTYFENGFTHHTKTNKRIPALIPVHMWGNPCEMELIKDLCSTRNIKIIEDASESLGSYYLNSRAHTGTLGDIGCLSFNGNKIVTSGNGGAILTNSKLIAEKVRYLSTQAKNDPVRYVHDEVGYNYRMSNVNAAIGKAQLENIESFIEAKQCLYEYYYSRCQEIEGLDLAPKPDYARNNNWLIVLRVNPDLYGESREELMLRLQDEGIQTRPIWSPAHKQLPYKNCGKMPIKKTLEAVDNSLCIPSSSFLGIDDAAVVMSNLSKK